LHPIISFVAEALVADADPARAQKMAAYMKTDMPFYGVQSPKQKVVIRLAGNRFKPQSFDDYERAIDALWSQPHREEKYVALGLAQRWKTFIEPQALGLYERLIREGQWWDLVDPVAAHLVGKVVLDFPDTTWPLIDQWIEDDNLWVRRTAVICQIRNGAKTDSARLFDYCRRRANETEFFMRKAIGWALREYAYKDPEAVYVFIKEQGDALSGLSRREASKHLERLMSAGG